jgi:hypothetical protein
MEKTSSCLEKICWQQVKEKQNFTSNKTHYHMEVAVLITAMTIILFSLIIIKELKNTTINISKSNTSVSVNAKKS